MDTTPTLSSSKAYWSDDNSVKELLKTAPEDMDHDSLVKVVRELDRRFMQLWDKVTFEREHSLVDYTKLNHG